MADLQDTLSRRLSEAPRGEEKERAGGRGERAGGWEGSRTGDREERGAGGWEGSRTGDREERAAGGREEWEEREAGGWEEREAGGWQETGEDPKRS